MFLTSSIWWPISRFLQAGKKQSAISPRLRKGLHRASEQSLIPADGLLVQIDIDLFRFQVFFNAPLSKLSAKSGLFVSTPRRLNICGLHVIDPDDAGAQLLHCAKRFKDIA